MVSSLNSHGGVGSSVGVLYIRESRKTSSKDGLITIWGTVRDTNNMKRCPVSFGVMRISIPRLFSQQGREQPLILPVFPFTTISFIHPFIHSSIHPFLLLLLLLLLFSQQTTKRNNAKDDAQEDYHE